MKIKIKGISVYVAIYATLTALLVLSLLFTLNAQAGQIEPNKAIIKGQLPIAQDREYTEKKMVISAYNPEVNQTDSSPFITANGNPVKDGVIACPRSLKFGTPVEINGKMYICQDRMNKRYTNNIDIFMWSTKEALAFGRQTLTIKIYE